MFFKYCNLRLACVKQQRSLCPGVSWALILVIGDIKNSIKILSCTWKMSFPLVYVFSTNAYLFWLCSLRILFMISRIFWNWCTHGPWHIFTQENDFLAKMTWLMYIRFEWLIFVEINCTRKTFSHFDKKIIDLVCDWFLSRLPIWRYLESSRNIEKIRSSSYQELRTRDRKIRKRRFYHIFTIVFLFIHIHTVYFAIKFDFRFPSDWYFSKLVTLLFPEERKVCIM